MPKVEDLARLLKAIGAQDWNAAQAASAVIIAEEERKGHHSAAQYLRSAMNPNGRSAQSPARMVSGDPGFLAAALTEVRCDTPLSEIALRSHQRRELTAIVSEWKHRAILASRKIPRRRKLLFFGPPGCGKSLTASALGMAISMPTYVVRIDAVVGAFLGQTALRIRELFRFAETTPCVLLLDEIDALARKRGSLRDVGELDRVVISLMQELEHAAPQGIVVATSNLPEHLDEALFRRFDDALEFPRPSQAEIARFASKRAAAGKIVPPRRLKSLLIGAKSYAETVRRVSAEERSLLLREVTG